VSISSAAPRRAGRLAPLDGAAPVIGPSAGLAFRPAPMIGVVTDGREVRGRWEASR
jgi:hypothetical protein